jgi:hypothetical protein
MTLEYMRKPAVVQRIINSQINEIVGGGRREAIPQELQPRDRHGTPYVDREEDDAHDTPPFGVGGDPAATTPTHAAAPNAGSAPGSGATPGTPHFEIRDRLIELDDLRRRGILSEEEFAAKKSELLNRI